MPTLFILLQQVVHFETPGRLQTGILLIPAERLDNPS